MNAKPYPLTDNYKAVPGRVTPGSLDRDTILRQQRQIRARLVATLGALAPTEFNSYRKSLSDNNEPDAARAAIQMISKMRELAGKPSPHPLVIQSVSTAWVLCLKLFKSCKSKEAQQLILDKWNDSFDREGELLDQQLTALYLEFDRRMLNTHFWELFKESRQTKTMSRICYVLYKHGDRTDAERLQKRFFEMAPDDERRPMIWNAFNCLQWRLAGNDPKMGPAAVFQ